MSADLMGSLGTGAPALTAALWRATWQGGMALALAWAIVRSCTDLPSGVRCWLWRLAYLKLLVAFVWCVPLALPLRQAKGEDSRPQMVGSPFIAAGWWPAGTAGSGPVERISSAIRPAGGSLRGLAERGGSPAGVSRSDRSAFAKRATEAAQARPSDRGYAPSRVSPTAGGGQQPTGLVCLMLLWLCGVGWGAMRVARECAVGGRLAREATPAGDGALQAQHEALCRRFGLGRSPDLRLSAAAGSPMLVGTVPPTLLLPSDLPAACAEMELEAILAHELAHLERCDLLWAWLPSAARMLFFFHPLVWLAQREWRLAHEIACDERAMQVTGASALEYGRVVLKVAARRPFAPAEPAAVGVAGSYESLLRRIAALLLLRPHSQRRLWLTGSLLALVGVAGIVPWRVTARAADARQTDGAAPGTRQGPVRKSGGLGTKASPAPHGPSKPLRYYAVVEQRNDLGRFRHRSRILYDQGRFRAEEYWRQPNERNLVELFDGSQPEVIWEYDREHRRARPSWDSSLQALWRESQRLGEARAKKLYGVPDNEPVGHGDHWPSPPLGVPFLSSYRELKLEPAGRGRVAGLECQIYRYRDVPAHFGVFVHTRDTLSGNPILTGRLWVEPRTQLVLRAEHVNEWPKESGVPPGRGVYEVRRLRFLPRVPLSRFQLPPGTTAHVPRIFRQVRLPRGVKRVAMTGKYPGSAGIGIGYPPAPPNGNSMPAKGNLSPPSRPAQQPYTEFPYYGFRGYKLHLLGKHRILEELQVTSVQRGQLEAVLTDLIERGRTLRPFGGSPPPWHGSPPPRESAEWKRLEQQDTARLGKLQQAQIETLERIGGILTRRQVTRLEQIALQLEGIDALWWVDTGEAMQRELKLTPAQIGKMQLIRQRIGAARSTLEPPRRSLSRA